MIDNSIAFKDLKTGNIIPDKIIKVNNKEIHIKQYLPVNDKLSLIGRVLSAISGNEYNFVNPVQLDVYTTIEIVKTYAGVSFDADMTPDQIYDALEQEQLANEIISAIPSVEYDFIVNGVQDTIAAYYAYQNSVLGILENVSKDYSALNFDATELQKKMSDPTQLTLLKNIVDKLG